MAQEIFRGAQTCSLLTVLFSSRQDDRGRVKRFTYNHIIISIVPTSNMKQFFAYSILVVFLFRHAYAENFCGSNADCLNDGACVLDTPDLSKATSIDCGPDGLKCYHGSKCAKPWSGTNRSRKYVCDCPEGLTGNGCELNSTVSYANCECQPGFGGITCEKPCECKNGGTCAVSPEDGSESCECPEGFIGDFCEISFVTCAGFRCLHGGKCTKPWANGNASPNWVCECPASWTGKECDEDPSAVTSIDVGETAKIDVGEDANVNVGEAAKIDVGEPANVNVDEGGGAGTFGVVVLILATTGLALYIFAALRIRKARGNQKRDGSPPESNINGHNSADLTDVYVDVFTTPPADSTEHVSPELSEVDRDNHISSTENREIV